MHAVLRVFLLLMSLLSFRDQCLKLSSKVNYKYISVVTIGGNLLTIYTPVTYIFARAWRNNFFSHLQQKFTPTAYTVSYWMRVYADYSNFQVIVCKEEYDLYCTRYMSPSIVTIVCGCHFLVTQYIFSRQ